jgi:Notch-like protein
LIPCSTTPCARGNCTNVDDFMDFECECPDFYVGKTCDAVDMCQFKEFLVGAAGELAASVYEPACGDNGVCITSNTTMALEVPYFDGSEVLSVAVSDFTCTCEPGFTGAICDVAIPCFPTDPCNGGTCVYDADVINEFDQIDWECTCPENLTGQYCQITLPCSSSPCENGAECEDVIVPGIVETWNYNCECLAGFSGRRCETAERSNNRVRSNSPKKFNQKRRSDNIDSPSTRFSGGASSFHPYGANGQPIGQGRHNRARG